MMEWANYEMGVLNYPAERVGRSIVRQLCSRLFRSTQSSTTPPFGYIPIRLRLSAMADRWDRQSYIVDEIQFIPQNSAGTEWEEKKLSYFYNTSSGALTALDRK